MALIFFWIFLAVWEESSHHFDRLNLYSGIYGPDQYRLDVITLDRAVLRSLPSLLAFSFISSTGWYVKRSHWIALSDVLDGIFGTPDIGTFSDDDFEGRRFRKVGFSDTTGYWLWNFDWRDIIMISSANSISHFHWISTNDWTNVRESPVQRLAKCQWDVSYY